MANKLKDTTPRPRIGKTAKDTRMARMIDVNQVVDEVNTELNVIDAAIDMLETTVEALLITPARSLRVANITENKTTEALSLAILNMTYSNLTHPTGFKVVCSSISDGGLMYIKVNSDNWVSVPITDVAKGK